MTPLLFLAHRLPFPPDKGDKIRAFHVLRHLASRFDVHLGCFSDRGDDPGQIGLLRELCAEVFCLPLARGKLATSLVQAIARKQSVSEALFSDRRMAGWVDETLSRHDIRHVYVFCSAMAPYMMSHNLGRQVVVDMVDVDSRKWGEYARSASRLFRPFFRIEQRRVQELETRAACAFDRVLFVSSAEAEAFSAVVPHRRAPITSMSNGVDSGYFDPAAVHQNPFAAGELPIVFTGAMDYRANVDAVVWFARACLPTVRKMHPRATFWIVGANPAAAVRRLTRENGIFVTGRVPDVRPYVSHAACSVAPLRIARGVQNKVLEAMAMARAVVATSAALEGIDARAGREILVAADAPGLSLRVSEVLSGHWAELGEAARAFVLRHHRWPEVLAVLDELVPDVDRTKQAGQEMMMPAAGAE